MSDKITIEEWMAELGKVSRFTDGATIHEIMAATGMGKDAVRSYLAKLKAEGRLIAGRKHIEAIDGSRRAAPAYRIKSANGKK